MDQESTPVETQAVETPEQTTPPVTNRGDFHEPQTESLEDLKARLAALESELKTTRKEAAARRIKEKDAQAATLSVEEQLTQERDRAAKAEERLLNAEIKAAATRAGMVKPEFAARFLDASKYERDEDGTITNLDDLFSELLESEPWLKREIDSKPADKASPTPPAVPAVRRAGAASSAAGSPAGTVFTSAQIADRAFYTAHKAEIEAALRDGRIV